MRLGPFLTFCVLAICGGLGWGAWEFRKEHAPAAPTIVGDSKDGGKPAGGGPGKNEPGGTTGTQTPVKPVDPVKPPVKPPDVVKPPVSPGTDPALPGVILAGEELMKQGRFAEAKRKFLQALSGRLSPEDKRRTEALQANASLYAGLVEQVNPADILPIEGRVIVHLVNGGKIDGVLEKRDGGGVDVRKRSGILAHFSSVQVDKVEEQSKEQVLKILNDEYEKRVKEMGAKAKGVDFYELAVFCIQNRLDERVPALLEKAVTMDRALLQEVAESKAKVLFNLMQFYAKKGNSAAADTKKRELMSKFPSSKYAKMASKETYVAKVDPPVKPVDPPVKPTDPPVKPPDPPVDPTDPADNGTPADSGPQPKFSNPKISAFVDEGNKWYDVGMDHLEKSLDQGNKDRDGENRKALDAFKKSCDALQAASDLDPDNAWINARLNSAQQNRVMCFLAAKVGR